MTCESICKEDIAVDRIKQAIAKKVQESVLDTNWDTLAPSDLIRPSEAQAMSKLETMISLRHSGGGRMFIVKVSEMY